jgi:RNA polymerase sigma-70 factor (ECF subfamily)
MPDEEQVPDDWPQRLRGEDREQAIGELRAILLKGLSKSLNNRYGKPFSAEDIVQDALLKILDSLDQFQGRSKFTTWAMTVATRIGISSLRRKFNQDTSLEAFANDDGSRIDVAVSSDDLSLEDAEQRDVMLSKLQSLIDNELSDKQRKAIRAFLSGFSTDTIADRMNMNRNAVYKLIHDARAKLKAGFERDGIIAADVQAIFA